MRWPVNPLVYEINTRVWLSELARGSGAARDLAGVPDETLDEIAGLGFDAVWLMGVWTTGPGAAEVARRHPGVLADCRRALPDLAEEDVVGSPYAVTAYGVSPELGGETGLARIRERLAARGVRLMLDFVPNHAALDNPLTDECPEAFVRGDGEDLERDPRAYFRTAGGRVLAHGRDPYFAPWTDTAQIDASTAAGREALRSWLAAIAELCDGVRCDMAMLLLPDVLQRTWGARLGPDTAPGSFWGEAIAAVKQRHPDFLFLAEAYWGLEGRLLDEGFDYVYDKTLYDRLRSDAPDTVRAHLGADPAFQTRLCRFVENHDEERAAAAFAADGGLAAAAIALCAPGMKLVHEGQLEGRRVRVPVQLARRPHEPPREEIARFYRALLPAVTASRAAGPHLAEVSAAPSGDWRDLVAVAWKGGACVVNLGAHPAAGRVALDPARELALRDRLTPQAEPSQVRLSCEVAFARRGVKLLELEQGDGLAPPAAAVS